jgi:hypothetical protein
MTKRLTAASLVLVVLVGEPVLSTAAPTTDRCSYHWTAWQTEHFGRIVYAGTKNVPDHTLHRLGYMESCQRDPGTATAVRTYNRQLAAEHRTRVAASSSAGAYGSTDLGNVPGVPYSFASCVAFRESTDGRLSWNIYGITSRYPGATVAEQKRTFAQMYAQYGTEPWAPYDGC